MSEHAKYLSKYRDGESSEIPEIIKKTSVFSKEARGHH